MKDINFFLFENNLILPESINFNNVMKIIDFYLKKTNKLDEIIINFKNVNDSSSCVLVFMISCVRSAIKKKQKVKFINVSNTINELIKLYSIDTIMPVI